MMWQLRYTRIYSAPVVYPEFKKRHLISILKKDIKNIDQIEKNIIIIKYLYQFALW